jgi:hypothetical protein
MLQRLAVFESRTKNSEGRNRRGPGRQDDFWSSVPGKDSTKIIAHAAAESFVVQAQFPLCTFPESRRSSAPSRHAIRLVMGECCQYALPGIHWKCSLFRGPVTSYDRGPGFPVQRADDHVQSSRYSSKTSECERRRPLRRREIVPAFNGFRAVRVDDAPGGSRAALTR